MDSIGDFFKQVRETKGLTVDEVASKTRIRTDFVKALEEGNFAKLPDQVFARGFVRSYARSLGLDEDDAIHRFIQSAGAFYEKQDERERLKVRQAEEERKRQANRKAVAIAIGIAILTLVILLSREQSSLLVRRPPTEPPPPSAKRTTTPKPQKPIRGVRLEIISLQSRSRNQGRQPRLQGARELIQARRTQHLLRLRRLRCRRSRPLPFHLPWPVREHWADSRWTDRRARRNPWCWTWKPPSSVGS